MGIGKQRSVQRYKEAEMGTVKQRWIQESRELHKGAEMDTGKQR